MLFPFRDNVPTRHTPVVTYGLIAVNVAVFLWMLLLPEDQQEELALRRGFIPARIGQLFHGRAIDVELPRGKIVTPQGVFLQVQEVRLPPAPRQTAASLVTYMFLHGGWLHLLGNMWFLWIFGDNVEDRLGPGLYLLLYLGGGIVALSCQWAVAPNSTLAVIGASGAVATVLGAYAVTWPFARVESLVFLLIFVTVIELPAMLFLGLWFLWQVLAAAQSLGPSDIGSQGGVAFWAHVGGFVAGLILMPWLDDFFRTKPPTTDH